MPIIVIILIIALIIGFIIKGQVMGKKLSDKGLAFLIEQETGRPNGKPELKPFPDGGAGGWSIGYGHFLGHFPTAPKITWTQAQAEAALRDDVKTAENIINTFVIVPLTQNQFDALVSFLYNVGTHIWDLNNPDRAETLLMLINTNNIKGMQEYFKHHFITDESGAPVLVSRRKAEMRLYMEGRA